jgi:hypothetical protein
MRRRGAKAGAKQAHSTRKASAHEGHMQAKRSKAGPTRAQRRRKAGANRAQRRSSADTKHAHSRRTAGAQMHKAGTADAKQAQGMRQAGGNQPARHTAANAQPTHNRHRWEIRAKCLCPVPKGPEQKVQNLRNPRNRKMHGRHCQEEQHCSWRPEEGRPERIGGATKKGHKVTQRPPQGLETGTSGCRRRSAGTWSSRTGGE